MDSVYNAGRTITYFMIWAYGFGGMVGLLVNWMILPGYASSRGGIVTQISLACGLLVGVIMAIVQAFTFHRDTNLVAYRRLAALGIGLLVGTVSTFTVALIQTDVQGLDELVILSATFLLSSLSAGFVARHYVMWRATLSVSKQDSEQPLKPLASPMEQIGTEALKLLKTRLIIWLYAFVAVGIVISLSQPIVPNKDSYWGNLNLSLGGLGTIFGVIALLLIATFAIGFYFIFLTSILSFLKTLIFNEYQPFSPHSTRLILTAMSLIWSLLLCRLVIFTTPLVMIIPFISTYYVYHSIALPDDAYDKAKRKEKPSLLTPA